MKMELLERGASSVWIRLEGRLDLRGVDEIQLPFTVKASRSERPVVVDLAGVTFIGSLAIGLLFSSARQLGLRGMRMIVFGATPHVEEVLRSAFLDQVAEILATEEEARAAVEAS